MLSPAKLEEVGKDLECSTPGLTKHKNKSTQIQCNQPVFELVRTKCNIQQTKSQNPYYTLSTKSST